MKPEIMQCNEVVTPLGVFAFMVAIMLGIVLVGLVTPWLGAWFERYMDWVAKKTGGYRG